MEKFIGLDDDNAKNSYKQNRLIIKKLKHRLIKNIDDAINVDEIERIAISKLDMNALSYYMSGANDELTLKRNKKQFEKILIYPRILVDVSDVKIATKILGSIVSMPILISPTAYHKLAHIDGELATARAAFTTSTIMTLSTLSNTTISNVAKANSNGVRWFQLYVLKDRLATLNLIREAESNNYTALVLTVDAPILGKRERDHQVKFKLPVGIFNENLKNLYENKEKISDEGNKSELFNYFENNIDASLTWDIIAWLRKETNLKIIIKGINRVDDALIAHKKGVDAIIISNHGARQLDTVPSTIELLFPISKALKNIPNNKMEIYIDGGFRRGTDVFKAIALGAKAVLLGRPILWGLAADGQKGIEKVLEIIRKEFIITMMLSGCKNLEDITEDYVRSKHYFSKF